MYNINVNQLSTFEITPGEETYLVNNNPVELDIVKNPNGTYHAIYKGRSYTVKVRDDKDSNLRLEINKEVFNTSLKNDLDRLLEKMGMNKTGGDKLDVLKAPMPGMVLKVMVKEGDTVKKGDGLLVLEAMKMENNIKAAGDAVVKEVCIKTGDKVEKNQVLINF